MTELGWDALWDRGRRRETPDERRAVLRARLRVLLPQVAIDGVIPPLEGGPFFRRLAEEWDVGEAEIADAAAGLGAWPWKARDVIRAARRRAREEADGSHGDARPGLLG